MCPYIISLANFWYLVLKERLHVVFSVVKHAIAKVQARDATQAEILLNNT